MIPPWNEMLIAWERSRVENAFTVWNLLALLFNILRLWVTIELNLVSAMQQETKCEEGWIFVWKCQLILNNPGTREANSFSATLGGQQPSPLLIFIDAKVKVTLTRNILKHHKNDTRKLDRRTWTHCLRKMQSSNKHDMVERAHETSGTHGVVIFSTHQLTHRQEDGPWIGMLPG